MSYDEFYYDPPREMVLWTEDGEIPDISWGDQLLAMDDAEFAAQWKEGMVPLDQYEGTRKFVYFIQLPDGTGYVGKGSRRLRPTQHLKDASDYPTMSEKRRKFRNSRWLIALRAWVNEARIYVIGECLDDQHAFALERRTIAHLGRIDIDNNGILYNWNEGGDGPTSNDMKRLHSDPEFKVKYEAGLHRTLDDPEYQARRRKLMQDPIYREKLRKNRPRRKVLPPYKISFREGTQLQKLFEALTRPEGCTVSYGMNITGISRFNIFSRFYEIGLSTRRIIDCDYETETYRLLGPDPQYTEADRIPILHKRPKEGLFHKNTKMHQLFLVLDRPEGCSLEEGMIVTGWKKRSTQYLFWKIANTARRILVLDYRTSTYSLGGPDPRWSKDGYQIEKRERPKRPPQSSFRKGTRRERLYQALIRPGGCTVEQGTAVTGWHTHVVRAQFKAIADILHQILTYDGNTYCLLVPDPERAVMRISSS